MFKEYRIQNSSIKLYVIMKHQNIFSYNLDVWQNVYNGLYFIVMVDFYFPLYCAPWKKFIQLYRPKDYYW